MPAREERNAVRLKRLAIGGEALHLLRAVGFRFTVDSSNLIAGQLRAGIPLNWSARSSREQRGEQKIWLLGHTTKSIYRRDTKRKRGESLRECVVAEERAVSVDEVVKGFELRSETVSAYLNLESGQALIFSDAEANLAESDIHDSDIPPAQREKIALIREYFGDPEIYIQLPQLEEEDEFLIMEEFCESLEHADLQREILKVLRGKTPRKRFEDLVRRLKLSAVWASYRRESLKILAEEWCEEQGLPVASEPR